MIKIKFNCKFINGKVRNMELPILLKEKLEQEIDEIELKKLKQSAQNISEKYRDKSSNKMSTRLIASREDAVAYAVSRMPATYGAVYSALKHSLEMMPNAEITSLLDAGAGTGTATWAVNEMLKTESNICVENEEYMLNLGQKLMKNEIDNVQWIKKNIITDNIEEKADLVISSYGASPSFNSLCTFVLATLHEKAHQSFFEILHSFSCAHAATIFAPFFIK